MKKMANVVDWLKSEKERRENAVHQFSDVIAERRDWGREETRVE